MGRGHGGTRSSGASSKAAAAASKMSPLQQQMRSIPLVTRDMGEYKPETDAEMRDMFDRWSVVTKKDGTQRLLAEVRDKYGTRDIEEAFSKWKAERSAEMRTNHERNQKLHRFEQFLHEHANHIQQSNISRSTYYQYKGTEYRFSDHVYPTGSMTQKWGDGSYAKIDFAADKHLIDDITW